MNSGRASWHQWLRVAEWCLGVLLITTGLWFVHTISILPDTIQSSVEQTFSRNTDGTLRIGETTLKWGCIDFDSIHVRSQYLPGPLMVRKVRVHVGYLDYFIRGFDPVQALENVEIIQPRLTLEQSPLEWIRHLQSMSGDSRFSLPDVELSLTGGSVVHAPFGSGTTEVILIDDLRGRFDVMTQIFSVRGAVLSDSTNMIARTRIGPDGKPGFWVAAERIDFGRIHDPGLADISGMASIDMTYIDTLDAALRFRQIELTTTDGLHAGPMDFVLRAQGNRAQWDRTEVTLGGMVVTTEGTVDWKDSVTVDASLAWSGDIDRIGSLVNADLADARGAVRGNVDINGPLFRPMLSVRLSADSLHTRFTEVRDVRIRCHTEALRGSLPDTLVLDAFSLRLDGARITGHGGGGLDPLNLNLSIRSSEIHLGGLKGMDRTGIEGTAVLSGSAHTDTTGTTGSLAVTLSDIRYRDTRIPVFFVEVTRDSLHRVMVLASGEGVNLEGRLFPPGSAPDSPSADTTARQIVFAGNAMLQEFMPPLEDSTSLPWFTGSLSVTIDEEELTLEGPLEVGTPYLAQIPTYLSLGYSLQSSADSARPSLTATLTSDALPLSPGFHPNLEVTASRTPSAWTLSGSLWDRAVSFRGSMGNDGWIASTIHVSSVSVPELARNGGVGKSLPAGTLNGNVNMRGRVDSLQAEGAFRLTGLTVKRMDSLDVTIPFRVTPDSIIWDRSPWFRNGRTVAWAEGRYRSGGDMEIVLESPSANGRLKHALDLAGTTLNADADALWRVTVTKTENTDVEIDADLFATQGQIVSIPFDTCTAHLYGDTRWLTIDADLEKHNEYAARCRSGRIPIGGGAGNELDLPIEMPADKGRNILGLLTGIIDQGVVGHGPGSAALRIAGTGSGAVIGSGRIEFHDGTLTWPGATWPQWRNVSGAADVISDTRFLQITRFSADVGEGQVTARNTPAEPIGAEPLPIPVVGLNLGAIQVNTPRPIPLHITGSMTRGEYLSMTVGGRGNLKSFYFAGPWDHPVAVGEARLSDGYFTYPPYEDVNQDTTGSSIIEIMNWQVDIVAGRDLYYHTRSAPENFWLTMLQDPFELLGSMAAELEAKLMEGGRLHVWGIYENDGLNVRTDNIASHEARMSVLNIDLSPDGPMELRWDTRQDPYPILRGRGVASIGDSVNIFARLVTIDPETRAVREGGRLEELTVELDTDEFLGDVSQREKQLAILRLLGFYSDSRQSQQLQTAEIGSAAYRALIRRSEQQAWRMMLRPFQRQLRRLTTIDVLQVEPSVVANLLDNEQPHDQLTYLQGTNWRVGEYFWGQFLVSYQGELELIGLDRPTLGARHCIGVEWAINPGTRFAVSRDIDVPYGAPDTRFSIMHRFTFQSY